jgi:tRNA1(Val) A37 N6-methylase TrmN6
MKNQEKIEINDLVYYDNLKIVQNKDYFNFSLDSVLLPCFVDILPSTKKILDLCTGNAPVPLILSTKTNAQIYGVELQKDIYDLAIKSVKINNIKNIEIINDDVNNLLNKFETDTFDIITCNPPYFKVKNTSILNNNDVKSLARHEISITLSDIINISKKLLKNNGSLCLVHRTERLIEIIEEMKNNNIEPKRIRFIYPKKNSESNLVLVDGRKNGKSGLKLLSPLIIHNEDNSYTDEVLKMFGK